MSDDALSLVIAHIRSTASLLLLRATCKAARREIGLDRVTGMPLELLQRLARPRSETIGCAKPVRPDEIGASFTDQGKSFWTWANTACGKVCINRYERVAAGQWRQISMYEASNPSATFLWLHVAEAGIISMLSATEDTLPIIFTAFRCEGRLPIFHCEIDKRLLLEDDIPAYSFNRRNLLFASWADRSFLVVLPISRRPTSIGLMRIESNTGSWTWWDISVTRDDQHTLLPIRAMCHRGRFIYIMPGFGGALFALDLAADVPHPEAVSTLPLLETEVALMQVCAAVAEEARCLSKLTARVCAAVVQVLPEKETHQILAYSTSETTLFHLDTTGASPPRRILSQALGAFLFVNATSALAFVQLSRSYFILNLTTGDVAMRCSLDRIPACVALHADALWSVGLDMLVQRAALE